MGTAVKQRHTLAYDDTSLEWVVKDCIRYIDGGGQNAFIDVRKPVYERLRVILAKKGYGMAFMYSHQAGFTARVSVFPIRDSLTEG